MTSDYNEKSALQNQREIAADRRASETRVHRDKIERDRAQRRDREQASKNATAEATARIKVESTEDIIKLQHELNKANRALDHSFNRAEDAREIERFSAELILKQDDDDVRHEWEKEDSLNILQGRVIELLAEAITKKRGGKIAKNQTKLEAEIELIRMSHETDEKIRLEKALLELRDGNSEKTDEEILEVLSRHIK